MTPWWPWSFPGEAERIIELVRKRPQWIAMPADANIFPRMRLFWCFRRRV